MKEKDIRKLLDLSPRKRAACLLTLGAELQKRRRKAHTSGTLPFSLKRPSIQRVVAVTLLERLHGIRGVAPRKVKGLRETGRTLKTKVGDVTDLVMTPHTMKKAIRSAMSRAKDKSVKDLAIRQLAVNMGESDPVTRCCAAYAYWQATGAEAGIPILANAIQSKDEEERIVAAHCLFKMKPRLVRSLAGTVKDDERHSPIQPIKKSMTVIIHGTFAMNSKWYQPGGNFHKYIKKNVYPDVYSQKKDFFFWSGRYDLDDRGLKNIWTKAAKKLAAWCQTHPAKTLRLIAHSHGNNVVNIATQMNLPTCTLIQLSPPVRKWNLPKMSSITSGTFFNIHSTIDLVVQIDGGAQDYKCTAVSPAEKRKIIAFFGHSDSHDPTKWAKKKVPKLVRSVCP